jgi:hypothetical protein
MGDETGLRTKQMKGDQYNSTDGQHRQGGGATGEVSGTRSIPDAYRVGQESGGEKQQNSTPGKARE